MSGLWVRRGQRGAWMPRSWGLMGLEPGFWILFYWEEGAEVQTQVLEGMGP